MTQDVKREVKIDILTTEFLRGKRKKINSGNGTEVYCHITGWFFLCEIKTSQQTQTQENDEVLYQQKVALLSLQKQTKNNCVSKQPN